MRGANVGPVPAHPIGIWLGAYKPRMLELTGRLADGWVPSYGGVNAESIGAASERIDAAAKAAGRELDAIRRVLNFGLPPDNETADLMIELAVRQGIDTFIVGEGDEDPRAHLTSFMNGVIPRVREAVEEARARR